MKFFFISMLLVTTVFAFCSRLASATATLVEGVDTSISGVAKVSAGSVGSTYYC